MIKKTLFALSLMLFVSCSNINTDNDFLSGIKLLNLINITKTKVLGLGVFTSKFDKYIKYDSENVKYKNAKLEIFKPKNKKNDKLIYIVHGGAYVYPLANIYRSLATYMLGVNDNYDIALLDYAVLPEARYPIANIQTEQGLEYLQTRYKNINMLGDSAGGNLVVSTLIKRIDEKKKLVNAVVLYSPFLDIDFSVDSRVRNRDKDILISNPYYKDYTYEKLLTDNDYYKNKKNKKEPYISPIYYDNYKYFPPTYIEVGKEEVLYDDSYILANKLNNVKMVSVSGLFHDFQIFLSIRTARESVKRTFDFLDKHN